MSKIHPGAVYISIAIVVGFFGIGAALLSGVAHPAVDSGVDGLLMGSLLGVAFSAFMTVVSFWLGSSLGSKTKDIDPATLPLPAPVVPPEKPKPPATVPTPPAPQSTPVPPLPTPIAPVTPSPPALPPPPRQMDITATMFAGPGDEQPSGYQDVPADWASHPGCALPYHFVGKRPHIKLFANDKSLVVPIVDVGPWYPSKLGPADQYWLTKDARPRAESDARTNGAGIDLTNSAAAYLGVPGKGKIDWEFDVVSALGGASPPSGVHLRAMAQTQADLERVFGKFTYTEGSGGDINIDQAWVAANIVSVDIPQLHKFTKGRPIECHRLIAEHLKAVFADIEVNGLLDLVLSYDGLWVPRHKGHDASRGLSLHSWGVAIDINAEWNPYQRPPTPLGAKGSTVALIPSFEAQGFAWGGYFNPPYQDAMHFEYAHST